MKKGQTFIKGEVFMKKSVFSISIAALLTICFSLVSCPSPEQGKPDNNPTPSELDDKVIWQAQDANGEEFISISDDVFENDYEIKSDYMEDTFIVSIDDNFNYIDADYFLPVYYSQKYNFNYSLEYDDWYTSVDYDFEEFDNYIKKIINEQYPMNSEKIDVRGIYSNYVQSWSSIDGVKYNSNYYIVSANNGKIPTTQELVNQLIKYNK